MIGAIRVISPMWYTLVNKAKRNKGEKSQGQALKVGVMGAVIWLILLVLCTRFVAQFAKYPEISDMLLTKILGVSMTAAAGLTVIATTIAGLSVFFAASDLRLLLVAPIDWMDRFLGQFVRIALTGSWAVLLVFTPVLYAVGRQFLWPDGFILVSLVGGAAILILASSIGMLLALLLGHLGGGGRARVGMGLIAAAVAVGLWWLIYQGGAGSRLLDAGRGSALAMVSLLETPEVSWAPTDWWARILMRATKGDVDILGIGALFSAAAISVAVTALFYRLWYRQVLGRAALGQGTNHSSAKVGRVYGWLEERIGTARAALLSKDMTRLLRTSSDWSHWILATVGYTLYVANLGALSLAEGEAVPRLLSQAVAIVSLGVGSLVLASLAVHTILPSVSLEGPGLSALRSAPISRGLPVRVKFGWGLCILVPLGTALSVWAEYKMGGSWRWLLTAGVVSTSISIGVVGMALWFGVRYPVFTAKSAGEVSGSSGATAFLLVAIVMTIAALMMIAPFAFNILADQPKDIIRRGVNQLPMWIQYTSFAAGILLPGGLGVYMARKAESLGLLVRG